jgi:hypothetical protein
VRRNQPLSMTPPQGRQELTRAVDAASAVRRGLDHGKPDCPVRASSRAPKFGSATPATIAAARRPDLWYNETALKIPGTAATA